MQRLWHVSDAQVKARRQSLRPEGCSANTGSASSFTEAGLQPLRAGAQDQAVCGGGWSERSSSSVAAATTARTPLTPGVFLMVRSSAGRRRV
jgi:hypothetical protein